MVKRPVRLAMAGEAVFPAPTDALKQDDIAVSHGPWALAVTPGHAAPDVKAG